MPGTSKSVTVATDDLLSPAVRKLSVVVPVFNERNTLVEILRRMRQVRLPEGIDREIIVVDDGSSDGSFIPDAFRASLARLADADGLVKKEEERW